MKPFVLDGANYDDEETFYDEVQRVLTDNFEGFGRNLDALNDVLRGGFGKFEADDKITIILKDPNYNIQPVYALAKDAKENPNITLQRKWTHKYEVHRYHTKSRVFTTKQHLYLFDIARLNEHSSIERDDFMAFFDDLGLNGGMIDVSIPGYDCGDVDENDSFVVSWHFSDQTETMVLTIVLKDQKKLDVLETALNKLKQLKQYENYTEDDDYE